VKQIPLLLLLLCSCHIYAQDLKQIAQDSSRLKSTETDYIDLVSNFQTTQKFNSPFESIVFKDVRFDTSSIGVTNKVPLLGDKNRFKYIHFWSGLAGSLNAYFSKLLNLPDNTTNKTDQLICYIKKFRVIEMDSTYEVNAKKERELRVKSVIESYYLHDSKMYPAFRIDTAISGRLAENKEGYFLIDTLLQSFTEKIHKIDTSKILHRNAYTQGDIVSRYQQRFDLPILNAQTFAKGVYVSRDEFFKNTPSIAEYEWKPDKKVNLLYTKDNNGQWNVTRKNIFGFCDGTNIWIVAQNSFYPAFRRENTFEIIAPLLLKRIVNNQPTTYTVPMGSYTYFITIPSKYNSIYYSDKSIYQMDMETGEFY